MIGPMNRKIELLAPGGDVDSIKAAIAAGADAIYCGLNKFNARNRATNIEFADLQGILALAHRNDCQIFLTLNIVILESEIPSLINLLNRLVNTSIDGVIIQDLGLFYLLANHFKKLKIHASTQMTTHNEGQIRFLNRLGATRINLSRELNLEEIKALTTVAHENHTEVEVFVHGSNCISFSGICYMGSVLEGKSGNRGRCSQPCREQYLTTPQGKKFPLNLKDNSAFADLGAIYDAGVDSIKIEGRIKKFPYVYTVVQAWRKQLDRLFTGSRLPDSDSTLYEIFNRDYTNAFLTGDLNKNMYIDNPRDNSAVRRREIDGCADAKSMLKAQNERHAKRTEFITDVAQKISKLSIEKAPLSLHFSGEAGAPLRVSVRTPETSFVMCSASKLIDASGRPGREPTNTPTINSAVVEQTAKNRNNTADGLNYAKLFHKFSALDDSEYCLADFDVEDLQPDLFIPTKDLTALKKKILFTLSGTRERFVPLKGPLSIRQTGPKIEPTLGVLISSAAHLDLANESSAEIFFELPAGLEKCASGLIDLLSEHRELIPWFPSVLIDKDYSAAVDILKQVQPELIVTNNSGIAYAAYAQGIPWIAGPALNIINSLSILGLKENVNCCGAFISNEISKNQIKNIINPGDFRLYYSIYHPILLLTSRQCLFHQVSGCGKSRIDEDCLPNCTKSASITNLKAVPLVIQKTKGNHHGIYHNHNFLNPEIVSDIPDLFSGFCIDLREIRTETTGGADKSGIIRMFENLLKGDPEAPEELRKTLHPTTNAQYQRGI